MSKETQATNSDIMAADFGAFGQAKKPTTLLAVTETSQNVHRMLGLQDVKKMDTNLDLARGNNFGIDFKRRQAAQEKRNGDLNQLIQTFRKDDPAIAKIMHGLLLIGMSTFNYWQGLHLMAEGVCDSINDISLLKLLDILELGEYEHLLQGEIESEETNIAVELKNFADAPDEETFQFHACRLLYLLRRYFE